MNRTRNFSFPRNFESCVAIAASHNRQRADPMMNPPIRGTDSYHVVCRQRDFVFNIRLPVIASIVTIPRLSGELRTPVADFF